LAAFECVVQTSACRCPGTLTFDEGRGRLAWAPVVDHPDVGTNRHHASNENIDVTPVEIGRRQTKQSFVRLKPEGDRVAQSQVVGRPMRSPSESGLRLANRAIAVAQRRFQQHSWVTESARLIPLPEFIGIEPAGCIGFAGIGCITLAARSSVHSSPSLTTGSQGNRHSDFSWNEYSPVVRSPLVMMMA
jgi:hypothetical protein